MAASVSTHPSVPTTMWSPCTRTYGKNLWSLLYGKNDILLQLVRIHLGPRSYIGGLAPSHREIVFESMLLNHPSTYSLIYSFICQYFHMQFIHPYAVFPSIHSLTHMPMFPSMEFICQYLQSASQTLLFLFLYSPVPAFPTIPSSTFLYLYPFIHPSVHLSFYFPVHLSIYLLSQPSIHSSKPEAPICWLNLSPGVVRWKF